jgi:hypothetical protein
LYATCVRGEMNAPAGFGWSSDTQWLLCSSGKSLSHLSLTTRVYFSVEYIRASLGVYLRETEA